jgi:hypothetical protein
MLFDNAVPAAEKLAETIIAFDCPLSFFTRTAKGRPGRICESFVTEKLVKKRVPICQPLEKFRL